MISLDSNVVISYLNPTDANHVPALATLKAYRAAGYVISPVVYAELRAWPYWAIIQRWLKDSHTRVVWDMPETVWDLAGQRSEAYTQQRRAGQWPRRLLADFLIGAHAEHHGLDLMSFDGTVYRSVFPTVTLIEPS